MDDEYKQHVFTVADAKCRFCKHIKYDAFKLQSDNNTTVVIL
jgi:hypothetical protein